MTRPRGLTDAVRRDWDALGRPTPDPPPFDREALSELPGPVRRWLTHAIAPGTPLRTAVELEMHGELRLGSWRPFTATQRMTPDGFVWAATARIAGLPVVGFDRLTRGSGAMRWRLLGAIPVMSATGGDVTRSAPGRLAGELLLVVPTGAPALAWASSDDAHATAAVGEHDVTLTIAPGGALTALTMTRWGDPQAAGYGPHRFSATFEGEVSFDGVTLPRSVTAGWEDDAFIRYVIDHARWV
jgi:hypothetical protein